MRTSKNTQNIMSKENEIKVLYYRKHTSKSVPVRGVLSFTSKHVSFQGNAGKHNIELQLARIRIEKFKGRVYSGVKVIDTDVSSGNTEYIFTKVSNEWYERIQDAIDAARVRHELEVTVKPRLKELSIEVDLDAEQEMSSVVGCVTTPFAVLFTVIFKTILSISKKITGHNYLLPNTMNEAISGVELALPPILTVSEKKQTKPVHLAVKEEVRGIIENLERIKSFGERRRLSDSVSGSVEDRRDEAILSKIHPLEILQSFKALVKRLIDFFFFVIWRFNLPLLKREQFILRRQPTTVAEAVRNANYKVNDLMELANEGHSKTRVISDISKIQEGLYNIKALNLTASSLSASSVDG